MSFRRHGARGAARGTVGVELSATRVRAADGLATRTSPLPPGAITGGEVRDPAAVARALRSVLDGFGRRPVRVGLPSPRTVTRTVEVPGGLGGQALTDAVTAAVADVLPTSLDDLVLGRTVLEDGERTRVLVVAAPRDQVLGLGAVLDTLPVRSAAIEAAGPALAAASADGIRLVVDVDAMTTVCVSEAGRCAFARTARTGTGGLVEYLVQTQGVAEEVAARYVRAVLADPDQAPGDGLEASMLGVVRHQVAELADQVAAEARSSLDFYRRSEGSQAVEEVLVVGEAADRWPDLPAVLEAELGLPVRRLSAEPGLLASLLSASGSATLEVPAGATPARRPTGTWTPRAAALGAAVVALSAVGVAVASERVESRTGTLARATADRDRLQREAELLAPFGALAERRAALEADARRALGRRFPWDEALAGVAQAAGRTVRLTGLRATVEATTSIAGSTGTGSRLRTAHPGPALELAGCAASTAAVSAFMVRLRALDGVADVALDSTRRRAEDASACPLPQRFSLVAFYDAQVAPLAAAVPAQVPDPGSAR